MRPSPPPDFKLEPGQEAYLRGDYTTAAKIWAPEAQQGDVAAQTSLGRLYRDGKGVAQDDAEAFKWLLLAANQNFASAQKDLCDMYWMDNVRAYMWCTLALENFSKWDPYAKLTAGKLILLERQMTPEQIDEAKKRAREWKPTKP